MSERTFPPLHSPATASPMSGDAPPTMTPSGVRRFAGIVGLTGMAWLTATAFLSPHLAGVAALTVFFIGLWATAVVPEYWTALAFFLSVTVLGIAPAEAVFSGFQSSTFWLLFSGLVLGAAIRDTGLDRRAASFLSGMLGARYASVIAGVATFGLALAFVMPSSMGRIVLLVPIVGALAERMGYGAGSNGRIGMLMAAVFGACLPAYAILPANAPNMILAGTAETLYGHHVTYWDYLALHFPILGAVKTAVMVALILRMFPDRDPEREAPTGRRAAPMGAGERRLVVVLGLCLALWLTDGAHRISPGWIALAAALYCLWPQSGLTSKDCLKRDVHLGSLLFVAGIIGLGAVISATGLGEAVVASLSAQVAFSGDRPLWNVAALTAISTLVAIVTNLPGVPAVMTPVAENLAAITGLPLATVLMTQVLAFSNVFLPYQAPPLITAVQVANLPIGAMSRLCLALFAIGVLVLIPLDLLWWRFLGMF